MIDFHHIELLFLYNLCIFLIVYIDSMWYIYIYISFFYIISLWSLKKNNSCNKIQNNLFKIENFVLKDHDDRPIKSCNTVRL